MVGTWLIATLQSYNICLVMQKEYEFRQERWLTQVELSRASIKLYEDNKVEIYLKKLSDISKALGS